MDELGTSELELTVQAIYRPYVKFEIPLHNSYNLVSKIIKAL